MAIDDWVKQLAGFSADQIELACIKYLRDQPRRRPTPGDVRAKVQSEAQVRSVSANRGDRASLTHDELVLLETEILPGARRWLDIPGLEDHGKQTLAYWGERI